jgi:hypothetical protein
VTSFCGLLIALAISLEVWVLQRNLLGLKLSVYNLGKSN